MRRSGAAWLALLLALLFTWTVRAAGGGTTVYLPYVSKQPTPTATPTPLPPLPSDYSVSYYVQTVNVADAYNYGCALGQTDQSTPGAQDHLVILDFGQPWYENGEYGTIVFRVGGVGDFTFANMDTVTSLAKNYAMGYWACTGSDDQSFLTLGIGTTNYLGQSTDAPMKNSSRLYTHGKLWAQMVLSVNAWLSTQGYAAQVYATGANDIEPSWATAAYTRDWIQGFDDYDDIGDGDNIAAIYFDYGSCDGCPQSYYSDIDSWPYMPSDWWMNDIWYVAWGAQPAGVVPEIYLSSEANAKQWQTISKYAKVQKGMRIDFSGVMTQYGACQQRGGCNGTMNTPQQGWNQLWKYTFADPDTRMDGLRWMTDIRYWTN